MMYDLLGSWRLLVLIDRLDYLSIHSLIGLIGFRSSFWASGPPAASAIWLELPLPFSECRSFILHHYNYRNITTFPLVFPFYSRSVVFILNHCFTTTPQAPLPFQLQRTLLFHSTPVGHSISYLVLDLESSLSSLSLFDGFWALRLRHDASILILWPLLSGPLASRTSTSLFRSVVHPLHQSLHLQRTAIPFG